MLSAVAAQAQTVRPHLRIPMPRLVLLVLVAFGCGKPFLNRPLSQAYPFGAVDPEYEVYSTFLSSFGMTVHVQDSTCRRCDRSVEPPKEFAEAFAAFLAINQAPILVHDQFAPSIHAHIVHGPLVGQEGCSGVPIVSLSRVGFSSDSTHAVFAYSYSVGAGPYPGCGYVVGQVVGYRRRLGYRWTYWRSLLSWIS